MFLLLQFVQKRKKRCTLISSLSLRTLLLMLWTMWRPGGTWIGKFHSFLICGSWTSLWRKSDSIPMLRLSLNNVIDVVVPRGWQSFSFQLDYRKLQCIKRHFSFSTVDVSVPKEPFWSQEQWDPKDMYRWRINSTSVFLFCSLSRTSIKWERPNDFNNYRNFLFSVFVDSQTT